MTYSQIFQFGSGTLWGVRSDVANSTPIQFGALQECSVDFSGASKELFGQYQFPVAAARGTSKITGKAKSGQIQGRIFADLFFGGTLGTGQLTEAPDEAGTIPGSGPYTVTVTNSGTYSADLGVKFSATGQPLIKVASGPTTGQYSVSAGVYTFAAADTALGVLISYQYTISGTGQKFTLTNPLIGVQPVFKVVLRGAYTGPNGQVYADLTLRSCIANKLSVATKLEDWVIPEFDFSAFADSSNTVFDWSFSQPS